MKELFNSYYIRFTLLTLSLAILALVVFSTLLTAQYFRAFPFVLVFIAGVTLIFHEVMMRSMRKNKQGFQVAYFTGTMVKLMIYLAAIVVYIFVIKTKTIAFVGTFFFLYMVYNAFETRYLMKRIRS